MSTGESLSFQIDIYSLETVKRAAYRFTNSAEIDINLRGNVIEVKATALSNQANGLPKTFVADFKRTVLDEDLRCIIATETELIRNTILSHVFSQSGLIENE